MNYTHLLGIEAVALFATLLALLEVGRRMGVRQLRGRGEENRAGLASIESAVFALAGLLIAFAFSGASTRFDARRQLIVDEANAIGTAYLRLDLLAPEAQGPLRDRFRRYVDLRLETYRLLPLDTAAAKRAYATSLELQGEIWDAAVAASGSGSHESAAILLLPALNEMIDLASTRYMALQMHPPGVVFAMLALVLLAGSVLAGYSLGANPNRNTMHVLAFAALQAMTVWVILGLEYPRVGLGQLETFDQALVDARRSMNEPPAH